MKKQPFFKRIDVAAFWLGTIVSFLAYFFTCGPSVTLEDSGELAVAGDYMGVPHPPGYPSWTVCAWFFSRLLSFVTFRGQPTPAWAIAVMSAFWGALSIGIMAMLVSKTSRDMLAARASEGESADSFSSIGFFAGLSSALVFAFAPVMWSQCTIVEVYSFNSFFLMLVLLLTYRWMCRPSSRLLVLTAFTFGLGLTNYQVLLLAMVPLVLVILFQDVALFRDFILFAIPFGLVCVIMKLGAENHQPGFCKFRVADGFDPTCSALVYPDGGISYTALCSVLVVAVIALCAAAAVLGMLSRGRLSDDSGKLRPVAFVVFALAALAVLVAVMAAPSAPFDSRFEYAPPEQMFKWGMPALMLVGGIAALWVFACFTPAGLWYAAACTGFLVPLAVLVCKGALLGLVHPLAGTFSAYCAVNVILLALAWLLLENGPTVALTALAGEVGVAFYGLMPILGDSCPPMNWGFPRTWEGFKHAVTRGQYEKITPTAMFNADFIRKLGSYFTDVRTQFTLVLAPLGFLPFAVWRLRTRGRRFDALPFSVACVAGIAALAILDKAFVAIDFANLRLDKILFLCLLLAMAFGLHVVFARQMVPLFRKALDRGADKSARVASGLSGLGLTVVSAAAVAGFAKAASAFIVESAFVWRDIAFIDANGDPTQSFRIVSMLLTFVLFVGWLGGVWWLVKRVDEDSETAIDSSASATIERWHIVTFVNFVMMSIVLIALANPRGDIQDAFIQKVKFIASHGLFALWIGYGLAYALFFFRRRKPVFVALCAAACFLPLIPVHENYRNFHMTDITSAAEQNGHEFGWQFGNYSLRGAPAITEELSDDEEPLPNPCYPEEMTPDAVFFGGTDPGRFVPTYMIYSALVRPDVFLITQNALADGTYLDTMRVITRYPRTDHESVYADDIWMPTEEDNRVAFTQYKEDVMSGKRPNRGGLTVDADGRVSVNGALEVMEINGILAENIFMHNRDEHGFYVEESYAIPWMYPYLSPNGLIMKLNHDNVRLTTENANADMDFWDWYSRRLVNDPAYIRDLPARKSFNKLRSALAGLYVNRRDMARAERAYREALSLYVYSPESTLRIIQDVLVPQRRFNEAVAILKQLAELDPNNTRLPVKELCELRDNAKLIDGLMARIKDTVNPLSESELLSLVRASLAVSQPYTAAEAINSAVNRKDISTEFFFTSAFLLSAAHYDREASAMLDRLDPKDVAASPHQKDIAAVHFNAGNYLAAGRALGNVLRADPKNCDAWIELAVCHNMLGDRPKVEAALRKAIAVDRVRTERTVVEKYPFLLEKNNSGANKTK